MIQKTTGILLAIAFGSAVAIVGVSATPVPLEGTNWKLSGWTGKNLVKDTEITAFFQKNKLAGSAGCNRYMTGYQVKDTSLTMKPEIAATMMACPEAQMKQEQQFIAALKGVREYAVNAAGELQLVYRTADGLGMLTFISAPPNPR